MPVGHFRPSEFYFKCLSLPPLIPHGLRFITTQTSITIDALRSRQNEKWKWNLSFIGLCTNGM